MIWKILTLKSCSNSFFFFVAMKPNKILNVIIKNLKLLLLASTTKFQLRVGHCNLGCNNFPNKPKYEDVHTFFCLLPNISLHFYLSVFLYIICPLFTVLFVSNVSLLFAFMRSKKGHLFRT